MEFGEGVLDREVLHFLIQYMYQKDERAESGKFQSNKFSFSPCSNKYR